MRGLLLVALLAGCASPSLAPTHPGEAPRAGAPPEDSSGSAPVALPPAESLDELLGAVRAEHGLPAVAALVRTSERVLAEGAVGARCGADGPPVELDDPWHLGS